MSSDKTMTIRLHHVMIYLIALLIIGTGASCKNTPDAPTMPGVGTQIKFGIKDVDPKLVNNSPSALVLSGTELPVDIKVTTTDQTIVLKLMAYGESLENEVYVVNNQEISLAEATGEKYSPPMPIFRNNLKVGDKWEWSGSMSSGGPASEAKGTLEVSMDSLNVPGFSDQAIIVRVKLEIQGGAPTPAKRELSFWFVPNKGILKREFGQASTRLPIKLNPESDLDEE